MREESIFATSLVVFFLSKDLSPDKGTHIQKRENAAKFLFFTQRMLGVRARAFSFVSNNKRAHTYTHNSIVE